jgi:hypothetical protein
MLFAAFHVGAAQVELPFDHTPRLRDADRAEGFCCAIPDDDFFVQEC